MTPQQRGGPAISTVDRSVVDAGGIVPRQRSGPALARERERGIDVVTARSYRHPALAGRTVVRIVPATLGEAEDLALEFLGFVPGAPPQPVGAGAGRALGFPAWALVHDPANGRHALAMVKELERLARLARTRPGAAKEGYDALADVLQRAVPHFLPTYWEQAGRSFVAADNPKTAAVCFASAREAERVHALPIDEDRVADVHLEFALAGALPVKALTQYAQDLAARLDADEAYRRYRTVAVQRVAGGLAPPAGLLGELGRLARAARLRPDGQAQSVLAELLALPAVAKSSGGFWQVARTDLVALCRKDPAVRLRLLAIQPDPPGWRTDITQEWVGLLDATGASDLLTAEPSTVDAGIWLERILARRGRTWGRTRSPALIAVVQRLLPRLLAENRELNPFGDSPYRADLDVLDVLIAGGVSVSRSDNGYLNVRAWVNDATPGRRDLVALAGYPHLAGPWRQGIVEALRHGGPDAIGALTAVDGIRAGLAAWLRERAEAAGMVTVLGLGDLLDELAPVRTQAGAGVDLAAARQLAAVPVAPALARTLRAGLAAELCWPAYDEGVGRFGVKVSLQRAAAWPYLIVHDNARAVVVGPDGVVLEHMLYFPPKTPPDSRVTVMSYVDGQLLVAWGDYRGRWGYWSQRPGDVFELPARDDWSAGAVESPRAITLPGGGVTTGGAPVRAGDRTLPEVRAVVSDGSAFWRLELPDGSGRAGHHWREYDPATGTGGRFSQPRFFDEAPRAVAAGECVLLPVGDGVVGLRVWPEGDGVVAGSDVDGHGVSLRSDANRRLRTVVLVPGADQPRAVTARTSGWYGSAGYTLHEPDTGLPASLVNVDRVVPPVRWWCFTVPRDPAGSRALRSLTDEQAAGLLLEPDGLPDDQRGVHAADSVRRVLPEITDEVLVARVAAEVVRARGAGMRLAEFGRYADSARTTSPSTAAPVGENALRRATAGLRLSSSTGGWYTAVERSVDIAGAVAAVGRSLTGPAATGPTAMVSLPAAAATDPATTPPGCDWLSMVGAEGALALRMLGPDLPDDERGALHVLLSAFAHCPLVGTGGRVRVVTLSTHGLPPHPGAVLRRGRHAGAVVSTETSWVGHRHFLAHVVELDPDGAFGPLDYGSLPRQEPSAALVGSTAGGAHGPLTVADDRRPAGWVDGGRLSELLQHFETQGPPPWRPEAVARLVELTGLSRGEAALLVAGAPGLTTTEANFLPKPVRERLGLGMTEARMARDSLAGVPSRDLVMMLDAALPDDPADLWRTGPDVERLAAAWARHVGPTVSLDPELAAELTRLAGAGAGGWWARQVASVMACVVGGGERDLLATGAFTARELCPYAIVLAGLAYRLPAGDPLRSRLPDALHRVRAWLADPTHTVPMGVHPADLDASAALRGEPTRYDPKLWNYALVPAMLSGPDDPVLGLFPGRNDVRAIAWLLSAGCGMLVDRFPDGIPSGSFPQDPRLATPSTVDLVSATLGLDTDAAAYYLQLLALPDPTDRNVARWTGWPAKRIKQLGTTLVDAGHAVVAKRERAGRSVFLPGGWLALKAPDLPVEAWKTRLYGLAPDGTGPLPVLVPTGPVADLFVDAWQRVTDGDTPRLERLGG